MISMLNESNVRQGATLDVELRLRQLARLRMLGWSTTKCAQAMGISIATVHRLQNCDQFREFTNAIQDGLDSGTIELRKQLDMAAQAALDTLTELMLEAEDPETKRKCAVTLLDKTIADAPKDVVVSGGINVGQYTAEELRHVLHSRLVRGRVGGDIGEPHEGGVGRPCEGD